MYTLDSPSPANTQIPRAIPSVHQPRQHQPVPQGQQERLEPGARLDGVVELAHLADVLVLALVRLALALGRGAVRVRLRVVGHEPAPQRVVADDQRPPAHQPLRGRGLGLGALQQRRQVRHVAGLLRVDEDDVVRPRGRYRERRQRRQGVADLQRDVAQRVGLEGRLSACCEFWVELEARYGARGSDGVGPRHG